MLEHSRRTLCLSLVSLLALATGCAAPEPLRFGAPLSPAPAKRVALEELLAAPERYDGAQLVVEGQVTQVCAKKGCWMTLAAGERQLRITFQDYGFFVPLDSAGAAVRAEGLFRIADTPVDEARHYLEDAGRQAEAAAITAPVRSFTLVASGVELRR